MKMHASLLLLTILAGCAPAPEPTATAAPTVAPTETPEVAITPGICDGVEAWASYVEAVYKNSVSVACGPFGDIPVEKAVECKEAALATWSTLTNMPPVPPIATTTHDLLRRALIYAVRSREAYQGREFDSAGKQEARFVEAMDQFRERKDIILALCGIDQGEIITNMRAAHALEDVTQRMLLADDPAVAERWRHEANQIIDAGLARPESERQQAIALVQSIAGPNARVEYLSTVPGVTGNEENYAVGATLYVVNVALDTLVSMNEVPRTDPNDPTRELDFSPRYKQQDLETMARGFVQTYAPGADLTKLTCTQGMYGHAGENYYWFAWDQTDPRYARIYIAYTPGGDIGSYLNTLLSTG